MTKKGGGGGAIRNRFIPEMVGYKVPSTLCFCTDSSDLTCETDTVTVKLITWGQQLFRGTVNTTW